MSGASDQGGGGTETAEAQEAPVLTRREGHAGIIILNRPEAINALTTEMVHLIQEALDDWAADDEVQTVVLTGAGERGLCAGGDIVSLWRDAKAGGTEAAEFWAAEYRLNAAISRYPKPYVALMDGIVLGGGIGLSAHGETRVVTERSSIGMPETGIGFLPDVGGTWLLSRAPGEIGTHLALTAGSVGPGDALAVGLADHYVASEDLPALLEALATTPAQEAVERFAAPAPESDLLAARGWIDEAYAGDDVQTIVDRLRERPEEAAHKAADRISTKSPTSLAITLRALREARGMGSLEEALAQEYRLALRCHAGHDFVEGVRAQVVDKDRKPSWDPSSLADVTPEQVTSYFAPLGDQELDLTTSTTPSKETS